jgi:hypothetical protein
MVDLPQHCVHHILILQLLQIYLVVRVVILYIIAVSIKFYIQINY